MTKDEVVVKTDHVMKAIEPPPAENVNSRCNDKFAGDPRKLIAIINSYFLK